MGNEGDGLSSKEMALCDWFVYIPQHGVGTASLNVACAASVVLYQFSTWAKYAESARDGYKFVVGPRPQKRGSKAVVPSSHPEEIREARRIAREQKMLKSGAAGDAGDVSNSGVPGGRPGDDGSRGEVAGAALGAGASASAGAGGAAGVRSGDAEPTLSN